MLKLWQTVSGRKLPLIIKEDNEATIKIINKGYSSKLRSLNRTHRVNLSAIHETVNHDDVRLEYVSTDIQAADIFTKNLEPNKWLPALKLLNMLELPTKS